ncbi:MAG: cysteine--tRNA ligase [Anaerolineae bacterium]
MALQIYNSLTRQKEDFVPLHGDHVGIYVCGPTVYGLAHVGHAKSYISFDIAVRYLRYIGYKVRYVQNITDVGHLTDDADEGEDKLVRKARFDRVHPMELAESYTRSYFTDMDMLNVGRPDIVPRASGHIPEQIVQIEQLIATGHAYVVNGSVYFSVESDPDYGKLSGRRVEDQEEGARVAINPEKRNPADFALWKRAEPAHILQWPSPWGAGYPGWHIECSAMSTKYLGQPFDIHGGGLENKFPHHEAEIAQAECASNDTPFARFWMHNNMVTVNGIKMGKSLGNYTTIQDAFKIVEPLALRFFVLSTHYRSSTDFSTGALEGAQKGYSRLLGAVRLVKQKLSAAADTGDMPAAVAGLLDETRARFRAAMDDDFNTAGAIAELFDFSRETNTLLNAATLPNRATVTALDSLYAELIGTVLGLLPAEGDNNSRLALLAVTDGLVAYLIELRNEARQQKQWAQADAIRNRLKDLGVALEDGAQGTGWRLAAG